MSPYRLGGSAGVVFLAQLGGAIQWAYHHIDTLSKMVISMQLRMSSPTFWPVRVDLKGVKACLLQLLPERDMKECTDAFKLVLYVD